MIRALLLLFIAILGTFFLVTLFAFDFATSVIPGWHTTILAPQQVLWLPIYVFAAFVIACYITAARKKRPIPQHLSIGYLLLTLPYPSLLCWFNYKGSQGYEFDLFLAPKFLIPSLILFITGQLFFAYFMLKMMRKKYA